MRNVIIVLGMHRSGTSAAAGLFVKLGGAQPTTLMPADDGNERGYFESQALMTFHDELLASAGSSWTDWRQFNPAWYQSPTGAAFRKRAKRLFKEEFDGAPLAVLKDPRVCRFVPFWLEVLAGMKARARVVIPVRGPLEVALSMRKRDGFSLATGALLWLRHIIDAEIASRALPRSIFTWDQLLRDWRGVAEKASTELGLRWPRLSDATAHEIETFLGDDLVHHEVSAPEHAAHPDIHEWTMSAYDAMLELAREPRSSSALKTLDEIRDAFNRASRMFGRTVLEDEIRSQDLRRQHDAASAELAEALQAKEQISLELHARAREASDLAQALAEQGCRREQAELALASEKSLNVQLANDLEGRTAELVDAVAAAEKVFTAERERRDALTARIAEADAELARERSLSESLKATHAATESKLAEVLARAQRAESEQASIAGKLRQEAAEADARAKEAGIRVLALEVKIAHLERDADRRERETAALLSSTSWRLSSPWRTYRRMVSRLRRLLHGKKMNPLFDREWYLEQYPDVRAGELDPYDHYLRHGAAEGRDPSPLFDTDWYLQQNLDVRESGGNPLVHFYLHGAAEGRDPHPPMDVRHWQTNARLTNPAELVLERPIGIFLHLFYDGVADEIASYLARIELPKKVYVTTDTVQKKVWIAETLDRYSVDAEIAVVPNCGFDIAAFLLGFPKQLEEHDICLKIHGKKSAHNPPDFSIAWRQHLFGELIGDSGRVRAIVNAFLSDPELGVLIPQHWTVLAGWLGIGANYEPMQRLLAKIGIDLVPGQDIQYPSGSMFWFRPEALSPLFELDLQWSDFSEPLDQHDCTLAHGVERCFLFFCARTKHKWAFIPELPSNLEDFDDETMQLIKQSGEFDETYYLKTYPDISKAGQNPLAHWINYGSGEGRNPSATFNTKYYCNQMPASSRGKINPLVHYLLEGRAQKLPTAPPAHLPGSIAVDNLYGAYVRAEAGRNYVGEAVPIIRRSDIKLIAFYLPQFHPFAENDKFWGRGFTEWTNATKALPLFKGHYQPRFPGELGFYDTRLKQVLARQIELAKQYGIHGFCLHHYFFDGKPLMRAPYDLLLANPDLDIPFCLDWANEPWTVHFDGLSTKTGLLLDQRHSPEDDLAFFRDIEPALRDRRYITIDGRPVLIVYRPGLFPDIGATLERWRNCCHQAGLKQLYMVMMQTSFEGAVDPRKYGFEAVIEFPPHNLGTSNVSRRIQFYDPGADVDVYDYEHAVDKALALPETQYRQFRGIMPEWDCTPRRANPAIFINCAPHRYQRWLEGLCAKTDGDSKRSRDEKLIFINSWNEWAEGAYLEPDRKFGYAYLDATARALNNYRPASTDALNLRILVAAHVFYLDLLDEFIAHFHRIPGRFDLLITTPIEKRDYVLQYVRERLGAVAHEIKVLGVQNAGFDYGPFILGMLPEAQNYDVCCKIHSKKTPYNSKFAGWREYLLGNLLSSPQNIAAIIEAFANDAKLGLVYPKVFPPVADHVEWGSNFEMTAALLQRLGITVTRDEQPVFPTGSMFWFRPKALRALLKLGLTLDDIVRSGEGPRVSESGPVIDGTLAHSLERMICYVAKAAGYGSREMLFDH